MSRFSLTANDGQQPSQTFDLLASTSADEVVTLPLIQQGYYLLDDSSNTSDLDNILLSRQGDSLLIHTEESSLPAAIIPGYYTSPAVLAVPVTETKIQAIDTTEVQDQVVSVSALSTTVDSDIVSADALPTPPWDGTSGILIDGITDDQGPATGDIANQGVTTPIVTDDLTPTLSGTVPHGAGMKLVIYANTQIIGTTVVNEDGTWSFTTPTLGEIGKSYTFEVIFGDPGGSGVLVSMPFTINAVEDGTTLADSNPPQGKLNIDGITDDNGLHQGNIANGGVTDDLTPTLHGHEPNAAGLTLLIFANTKLLGSVLVDENGDWSYTPDLEDNSQYTFEVLMKDPGSDTYITSMPYTVTTGFDYAVPGISSVNDNVGSKVGELTSGQPTDDTTPTITGTADPNTIVNIYDGDTLLGSAQVDANGAWSFTPETALSGDGDHVITTTSTDGTSESAHSDDFIVNLDTVAEKPVITNIQDDVGPITGNVLEHGNITDDSTLTISGTSEPGSTLTLYYSDSNNAINTIALTPNSDGTWSIPVTLPTEGNYSYWVAATDLAGNQSISDMVKIVYDTTAPDTATNQVLTDDVGDITGPIVSGDVTDDANPTYSGQAEPNATVVIYDNGAAIGSVVADSKGSWSFTPTEALADGEHSFSTVVVDGNGNQSSASPSIDFTVDTSAPDVIDITAPDNLLVTDDVGTITGPIANGDVTDDANPTFSGKNQVPGNTIIITDNGTELGSALVDAEGNWSFTPVTPMDEGDHQIELIAKDPAGNHSDPSASFDFSIDTTAPDVIDITAPDNLLVTDDVGTITGPLASGDVTDDANPTFSGKNQEPGNTIIITDNGTELGSALVDENGNWSFTPETPMDDGDHQIKLIAEDPAGNRSEPSASFEVTVDTTAPDAVTSPVLTDDVGDITGPITNGDVTDDTQPTFSGQAEPGATVIVSDNGTVLGSVTVDAVGNWSFTPSEALAEGDHSFSAVVQDAAGNQSTASDPINFVVNTATPEAITDPVLTDDAGTITGPITSGDVTDDTTPTFSGKAEPGTTVIVSDNGDVIGSAAVDPDGNWSFTPDTPLEEGDHSLTAVVENTAGNQSPPSDPINITVDTTAPDAVTSPVLTDDVGDITGPIASGDVTDDTQPTFSGKAEPNATVIVSDSGTVLGSVAVDADGNWSFTPSEALAEGDHSFSAVVEDAAGNQSVASDPIDFTIDTTAPDVIDITAPDNLLVTDDVGTITGPLASGDVTDDANPTFSGKNQEPGNTVIITDNGTELGSALVDENGNWSFTPETPLADGDHQIALIAEDPAGNRSEPSASFEVVVDTTAPDTVTSPVLTDDAGTITGPIASGDVTDDTTPTLSGKAEPGATVIVSDNGNVIGSAAVDPDGNWSFTPDTPLEEGDHSLTAVVEDAAGNQSPPSDPINITVDTTAPDAVTSPVLTDDVGDITGPITSGDVTDDTTPTFSGKAEPNATVIVSDNGTVLGSAAVDPDGNWSFTPSEALAEGDHSFSAVVEDAAGNQSVASDPIDFTIDTTAPDAIDITAPDNLLVTDDVGTITGPLASGDVTDDATPTFSGKNQEPGNTVIITDNGTEVGSALVDENGDWTFTPETPLADGDHQIALIAEDPAGNRSEPSAPFEVTVDTTAPDAITHPVLTDDVGDITGPIANGDVTDDTQPTFSGQAEPDATVIVSDNGTVIGSVAVDPDGNWSFTPSEALAEGDHSFSAVVEDTAGNQSEASDPINFTINSTAVTISIDSVVDDVEPGTGNIDNAGITNDNQPTINGSATASCVVTVYDKGVLLGSTLSDASGAWKFTPANALADGEHDFTATVTTPATGESAPTEAWAINIDTVAPSVITSPTLTDDVGDITGPITNGGLTDDNQPTYSGKAEPGATVIVSDDGTVIGSTVVNADGTWSFTPPEALADGEHSFTAVVEDAAGNQSPDSEAINFTVDATPPESASNVVIVDNSGDQTGNVVPDGATDDTQPTIEGNAEPGSTVIINDNGEPIGSVAVNPDGSWSFTPDTPLSDGEHAIDTVVVDPAGNKSEPSDTISFAVVATGSDNFDADAKHILGLNEEYTLDSGLTFTNVTSGREDGINFNEITDKGVWFFAPDSFGTQVLTLLAQSVTQVSFGGETNSVSFDVAAVSAAGGSVHYFDADGKELFSQDIPTSPDTQVTNISWEAPEGELISYITINVGSEAGDALIRVDNFTWGSEQLTTPSAATLMAAVEDSQSDALQLVNATVDAHSNASQGHLSLSLDEVLSHSEQNLFVNDGKSQFAITGESGDQIELTGISESSLTQHSDITSGGVTYDVYTVSGSNTELLVQHGLELHPTA
ncbi:Ig-like domain-containing protein [Jejubacter calystegiae]|nr:Ig-like domain-containing protein [Jejubacter calystegiae]